MVVQMLCLVFVCDVDLVLIMECMVDVVVDVLCVNLFLVVLVLLDYGVELDWGIGLMWLFYLLEEWFKLLVIYLMLLCLVEYVQNWVVMLFVMLVMGWLFSLY